MSGSTQPVRSMTGYARLRKVVPEGELVISIKSLNHRGLDVRLHLSTELEPSENAVRGLISRRLVRGHVDVRISFSKMGSGDLPGVNRPLLEGYVTAFRQAAHQFGLKAEPDLNTAFRVPGMFGDTAGTEFTPDFELVLLATLDETLDALNAFRTREGGQLAEDLLARCANIQQCALRVEEIRSQATAIVQARLAERMSQLLKGVSLDPQRLALEAALLADRSDIGEEVARLKIHASRLGGLLSDGGEIGKKLDFLLQEMHRETNTILSKTSGMGELGLEITDLALGAKSEIEKIREQALNLE